MLSNAKITLNIPHGENCYITSYEIVNVTYSVGDCYIVNSIYNDNRNVIL